MPSPPARPSTGLRIQPFRAVRYDPTLAGDLSHVICPPYDDMAPAHARALRRRPHHLARLQYAHDPHEAAYQLDRWLRRGVLRRDARPALYVYQQQRGARITQRGLIGGAGPAPGLRSVDPSPRGRTTSRSRSGQLSWPVCTPSWSHSC